MKKDILELHPTQIAVGFEQVDEKIHKMKKMRKSELDEYIKDHVVPVVRGYDDKLFLIDHHHFCCAALQLGIEKAFIDIVDDLSELSYNDFWNHMLKNGKIWPFNENGEEIELFSFIKHLPNNVKGLKDDPYRSMAGILRKQGVYDKDWTPFSEFHVANTLRTKIHLGGTEAFSDANIDKAKLVLENSKK
jgi:hypothetical protein